MGLSIAAMHYTGMAAVCFYQGGGMGGGSHMISVSSLGTICIAAVTFAVLGLTLLGSLANRKFSQQKMLLDSATERWGLVISASQDGLFDVDLTTGATYCSPRWMTMFGHSLDRKMELLSWQEFLHPDEREQVVASQARYLASGQGSLELQFRYRHCDGRWLWVLCRAQATWDQHGKPVRLTGSYTDITQRVGHEERLRASEARYRELFEYNPLPAWIYRIGDLQILDVNRAAINHYGYTREEFLANTVAMLRMEGEAESVEAELRATAHSHTPTKPIEHRRKNKSNIWVELCHQNLEFGGVPARLTINYDITARVDAENVLRQERAQMETLVTERTAELRTSEAKWRGLVEAMPNFISLTTTDGLLTYSSSQLEAYTGIPNAQLQSTGFLNSVHPEDRAKVEASLQERRHTKAQYECEFRIRSKDGSYRWFLSRVRPIFQSPEVLSQWLHSTVDIDDQKRNKDRLEEAVAQRTLALAEALDQAQSASRIKSEFLATMSHEIRTPLNGVIGMTHLMESTPLNSTQQNYLDTIHSSGQALLAIINDILDFSKIEAGKMELYEEEFDVRKVIETSIEMVTPTAAEKHLELSLDMETDGFLLVGDAGRFQQVLLNLLSNAVKFTREGSVQLSVAPDPENCNMLRFSIRDTGIGLSPEQQANLFQAFTQADRSTTRRFGGTGLGLSIVKRMVNLMGGQVGVTSRLGEGSVFWFNLPLHRKQSSLAAPRPAVLTKARSFKNIFAERQARVLVADDVTINQRVAAGILREVGLRSDIVSDGVQAVAACEHTAYDLILMDVQMPEMDGLEATRRIRAKQLPASPLQKRVSIIALTANVLPSDRQKYLDAGMDDFVSKPIIAENLVEVLERWLPQELLQTARSADVVRPPVDELASPLSGRSRSRTPIR
jgi:PAS domain S-box-containing protein